MVLFILDDLSFEAFSRAQAIKDLSANGGDGGDGDLIPELGRSPGGGNGNSIQYSCLENPMGRGVWRATFMRS